MTLEQAKELKEGHELWYNGLEGFPEKVVVDHVSSTEAGKLEIHLVDNCFIPERDMEEYVFCTFEECAKACEKGFKEKLEKLREMLKLEK